MTRSVEDERAEIARVGLCATCAFAQVQGSAKASGSRFYRCTRADDEPAYPKYPPIPVVGCAGHTRGGEPEAGREPDARRGT